jgi:RHS repeat-associated protein
MNTEEGRMTRTNRAYKPSPIASPTVKLWRLWALLLFALLPLSQAGAQTGGAAPPNNAAGRPAGSHQLSGFDNVNLFNRNLNFSLPLVQIGGRGVQVPVTLSIDSTKWKLGRDGGLVNESASLNLNPDFEFERIIYLYDLPGASPEHPVPISAFSTYDHSMVIDRLGGGLTDAGGTLTDARYFTLDPNGWQGAEPGYGPGVVQGRLTARRSMRGVITSTLTRIVFTAPDGTELELRDQATYGRPFLVNQTNPPRGNVFVSADGTATTFISDASLTDNPSEIVAHPADDGSPDLLIFGPYGFLIFADGTRYRVENGLIRWVRDRNGNLTTFGYDPAGRVTSITDSLNRVVTISYVDRPDPSDPTLTTRDYDHISFRGVGGQPRAIRVWHKKLSEAGVLRPDFPVGNTHRTYHALFPEYELAPGNLVFDKSVASSVELPDGRRYEILYNHHGEIARVVLPTGGAIEYDYKTSASSVTLQRPIWRRRVYENGGGVTSSGDIGTPTLTQTFNASQSGNGADQPYTTTVMAEQWQGPDGAAGLLLSRERHFFSGRADALNVGYYPPAKEGKRLKVEALGVTGDAGAAPVLRSVAYEWRQRPVASPQESWTNNIQRDMRMVESVTTLENGLMSKQTSVDPDDSSWVGFDRYNNQTDVWEYDFKAAGEPWHLLRRTHTAYVSLPAYTEAPAHLRSLVMEQTVYDAAGVARSRITFEYDNYTPDPANGNRHARLIQYDRISGLCLQLTHVFDCETPSDSSYETRGNMTGMTAYLLDGEGNVTGSVTTNRQYDVAGNVLKIIDARRKPDGSGYETVFDFSDNFGEPDEEARANSAPDQLGTLMSYALPKKVTNALGHTTHTQYDYNTGQVVNFEDANGTVMSLSYDDPLDRLRRVEKAANSHGLRSQTAYQYDDPARKIITTSDLRTFEDNRLVNETRYDGLGRVTETRHYETAAQYISTFQDYDALDRLRRSSNPHRPSLGETPVWTTTEYDALGRLWRVTTPDGAQTITLHDGNRTLVTDPAGKQRAVKVDALGRLTDVWEVRSRHPVTGTEDFTFPVPTGLNVPGVSAGYRTTYTYDALDNLHKVAQGEQSRYFAYDSLSRLIRAKSPEQDARPGLALPSAMLSTLSDNNNGWAYAYEYDEVGNLKRRIDARGVEANYNYDGLNRMTGRSYTDVTTPEGTTVSTPPVKYFYDLQPLPQGAPVFARGKSVGALVAVTYGVGESATGSYVGGYDELGRAHLSAQVVAVGGHNGTTSLQHYMMGYEYYVGGNLKSQTYPSGKVVELQYDGAGRLAGLKREGADYYAGGDPEVANNPNVIKYAAHGAVAEMRLGNGLWESTSFNTRFQIKSIGLGATPTASGLLRLDYEYGGTNNNGNLRAQKITAAATPSAPALAFTQSYTYDALNRLDSAREGNDISPCLDQDNAPADCWKQTFTYDRFGNRRFNQGATETTLPAITSLNQNEANPSISTTTNRVSGAGYGYDPAGNLTTAPDGASLRVFEYDAEGRQVTFKRNQAPAAAYFYDGDGKRVRKVSDATDTVFIYDIAGRLVAEYSNQVAPNGISYLTVDSLGSTRVVTNRDGVVVGRYDYEPFGAELSRNHQGGSVRQKFASKERDSETGLDYFTARYYASSQGRFTSPDEFKGGPAELFLLGSGDPERQALPYAEIANPQTLNKYQYCLNNPLRYVDPTGHQQKEGWYDKLLKNLYYLWQAFGVPNDGMLNPSASEERRPERTHYLPFPSAQELAKHSWVNFGQGLDQFAEMLTAAEPTGITSDAGKVLKGDYSGLAVSGVFRAGGPALSRFFGTTIGKLFSGRLLVGNNEGIEVVAQFTKSGKTLSADIVYVGGASGKGLSSTVGALYKNILALAQQQGADKLVLNAVAVVNKDLDDMLKKRGFEKTTVWIQGHGQVEAYTKVINVPKK